MSPLPMTLRSDDAPGWDRRRSTVPSAREREEPWAACPGTEQRAWVPSCGGDLGAEVLELRGSGSLTLLVVDRSPVVEVLRPGVDWSLIVLAGDHGADRRRTPARRMHEHATCATRRRGSARTTTPRIASCMASRRSWLKRERHCARAERRRRERSGLCATPAATDRARRRPVGADPRSGSTPPHRNPDPAVVRPAAPVARLVGEASSAVLEGLGSAGLEDRASRQRRQVVGEQRAPAATTGVGVARAGTRRRTCRAVGRSRRRSGRRVRAPRGGRAPARATSPGSPGRPRWRWSARRTRPYAAPVGRRRRRRRHPARPRPAPTHPVRRRRGRPQPRSSRPRSRRSRCPASRRHR